MEDLGKDHLLTCFDLSENRNSSWVNRNQPSYPKPSVINFYFIDEFFKDKITILNRLDSRKGDIQIFVSTIDEPSTDYIDEQVKILYSKNITRPAAIVGMGGGITLDVAKAISNLLTNGGKSEQYQGWDLVKKPGIYKVAIPTLSGTGAEATRTCVLTNNKTGLKSIKAVAIQNHI